MTEELLMLIKAIAAVTKLKADGRFAQLHEHAAAFVAAARAVLPKKPDGTAWSDDEIAQMALVADIPWETLKNIVNAPLGS